ncbi:MAG: aspartate/glutamate racemase family protein [Pseudomonadota bacterium]
MHIGLIGGIGPAATDLYYRRLIELAADKAVDLDLTMVHADSPTLLANMAAGQGDAQTEIYLRLTDRLARAGADCVVVTSISGHFCIDQFSDVSPLPVVDMIAAISAALIRDGIKRVGLLGTETVMASGMYGKLAGVDVLAPEHDLMRRVHSAYIGLARTAKPTKALRAILFEAGLQMAHEFGAEAILLGGTDLNIAFEGQTPGFRTIDCAGIHIEEIAKRL